MSGILVDTMVWQAMDRRLVELVDAGLAYAHPYICVELALTGSGSKVGELAELLGGLPCAPVVPAGRCAPWPLAFESCTTPKREGTARASRGAQPPRSGLQDLVRRAAALTQDRDPVVDWKARRAHAPWSGAGTSARPGNA